MKLILALLMALALASSACAEGDVPQLLEPVGVTMDTAVAYVGTLRETVMYDAYVSPEVYPLSFTIDGRFGEINVVVGQQVKAGDVLVTLDHEALEESVADMERAIAAREKSGEYDDTIAMIDIEILTLDLEDLLCAEPVDEKAVQLKRLEIEERELAWEKAKKLRQYELEEMYDELEKAKSDLGKGVMTAPCDGTVAYIVGAENGAAEPGAYIGAYSPVIYLADESRLSIVSEFISSMELAGAKEIYVLVGGHNVKVVHREMDYETYTALVMTGSEINITFDFEEEPPADVQAGMFAAVCVVRNMAEDALLIPSNAVFRDESGTYVYLVEDGVRTRRDIVIGLYTPWETQVLEGIEEGDTVYVQE